MSTELFTDWAGIVCVPGCGLAKPLMCSLMPNQRHITEYYVTCLSVSSDLEETDLSSPLRGRGRSEFVIHCDFAVPTRSWGDPVTG